MVATRLRLGVLGLALGYFLWYTPYAALTKALSSGLLPGIDHRVGGLVLLPAAALGTLVGSVLFLAGSGWWRYARKREVRGVRVPWPSRTLVTAAFFMAIVIATTTLNYTFAGVSILFMLLMMRGGVLILSPIVDAFRRRPVMAWSWFAVVLSLLAVTTALVDVDHYALTVGAVASVAAYFIGYIGRFRIMSRVAKTGDEWIDRGYLVDEQIAAAVWQVVLCGLFALAGVGALREGFTTFLATPAAIAAFGVGLLYEALFIYGTLIYLDPREYTWCVPANRCASVLSGVVASYGLAWITGIPVPGRGQVAATVLIGLAILALAYPALRETAIRLAPALPIRRRRQLLLFVCNGNTSRSPMAEAICRAELATLTKLDTPGGANPRIAVASAGLTATGGASMSDGAATALRHLGVPVHRHRSRRLETGTCRESTAVYCMTEDQRAAVASLAPDMSGRTFRLDPAGDITEPAEADAYDALAQRIRVAVRQRVREHAAAQAG